MLELRGGVGLGVGGWGLVMGQKLSEREKLWSQIALESTNVLLFDLFYLTCDACIS